MGQHDIKRLLAYSSVENMGIIAMGLGLALLGRAEGRDDWVVLGLGGALLHVWNHALFKSLLFLVAGTIIHAAGTARWIGLGGLGQTHAQVDDVVRDGGSGHLCSAAAQWLRQRMARVSRACFGP